MTPKRPVSVVRDQLHLSLVHTKMDLELNECLVDRLVSPLPRGLYGNCHAPLPYWDGRHATIRVALSLSLPDDIRLTSRVFQLLVSSAHARRGGGRGGGGAQVSIRDERLGHRRK